jgi:hypothetical protein
MQKTIKVGTLTLTLKKNKEVFYRYEGLTSVGRVLIRQEPWGTWNGCIVLQGTVGGCIVNVGRGELNPEDVVPLLLEKAKLFHQALSEVLEKTKTPST